MHDTNHAADVRLAFCLCGATSQSQRGLAAAMKLARQAQNKCKQRKRGAGGDYLTPLPVAPHYMVTEHQFCACGVPAPEQPGN